MAAKITVEITCDGCGKQVKLPGVFREWNPSVIEQDLVVENIWMVGPISGSSHGVGIIEGSPIPQREGRLLACSTACALKIAERLMVRPNSDEKEKAE